MDDSQVRHQETLQVSFLSSTSYRVDGSVSGLIEPGAIYTSGVPIQVAGVEFTLSGPAAAGDLYRIDVVSTGRAVDDAIDRILRVRSDLAGAFRQIENAGDADDANLTERTVALSDLEDLDVASEIGDLSRNEILRQAEFNVIGQIQFARDRVLEFLRRVLVEGA
ncbi:MAG: hypothetical protein HY720_13720 [Planctomycetes bacterium]|nr:hypothetical protein [Planctomycetota bacterium]